MVSRCDKGGLAGRYFNFSTTIGIQVMTPMQRLSALAAIITSSTSWVLLAVPL